ncbi:MAG: glutamate--tRNA ligase family protein [Candidatus Nanopelagicales bacterium]|nr:glutamate--tRNA ligase family protein [Candidatus Nanopelagicales bacterium]
MLVTRIAPTPSGYLHVGNAVNMVLTSWLARGHGGRLLLRIDDFDTGRARADYLEDVFRTLDWLGITIDEGPSGPDEFHCAWSMSTRIDRFRAVRDQLMADQNASVFVCRCSRRALDPAGRCAAGCREQRLPLEPGGTALRIRVPAGSARGLPLPPGDHVLWRRDDLPAYQLGSVVADEDLGVTAIVRGVDLVASSALQLHLAGLLATPRFRQVDLRHHALVTAPDGHKLSKSAGAQAHPLEHSDRLRAQLHDWARALGASLGITPP